MQSDRADLDLAKAASPEIYGKSCAGCGADLDWLYFRKDASMRDGYAHLCLDCEASPRLSVAEHSARLYERNYNSEAVKRQRWEDQDQLKNDSARVGRPLLHSDFLAIVQKLVPNLYITPGRIQGHLAVFQVAPCPQPAWEDRDFKYLFFMPEGLLPEFSQYEFSTDGMDIPVREKRRGWRTVLLRLVKARLLSEETCNKVFGRAEGVASERYNKQLKEFRSRT